MFKKKKEKKGNKITNSFDNALAGKYLDQLNQIKSSRHFDDAQIKSSSLNSHEKS